MSEPEENTPPVSPQQKDTNEDPQKSTEKQTTQQRPQMNVRKIFESINPDQKTEE